MGEMPAHDRLNFISANEAVLIMQLVHMDFGILGARPTAAILKVPENVAAPAA